MLRMFFPSIIRPQQVLRAYVLRRKHPRFTSLDQCFSITIFKHVWRQAAPRG